MRVLALFVGAATALRPAFVQQPVTPPATGAAPPVDATPAGAPAAAPPPVVTPPVDTTPAGAPPVAVEKEVPPMWEPGMKTIHHYKASEKPTIKEAQQMARERKIKRLHAEGKKPADGALPVPIEIESPIKIHPMSAAMSAVITMSAQYFVLYTVMAIARTYATVAGSENKIGPTLIAATATVNFVPMLSIAILAIRIRAVFLTSTPMNGGRPDDFNLPPWWVKEAFSWCSLSIFVQLVLIFIYPAITGKSLDPRKDIDSDGNLISESEPGLAGNIIKWTRNLVFLALYVGMAAIVYCLGSMEAPEEIMKANAWAKQPELPPSMLGTINLVILYFVIYLAIAVVREFFKDDKPVLFGVLNLCAWSVNLAPMLAVLFISARLRALQIRSSGTAGEFEVPDWTQTCFHLCWISMYAQCALILLVVFLKGTVKQGEFYGDVEFKMTNPQAFVALYCVRWIAQLSCYGGLVGCILGICQMQHPMGPEHTPELSTAVKCVIALTFQFFFVYVGIFVIASLRQFTSGGFVTARATFAAAQATVMFCPMLCILFLGARARALEITAGKGAPPGWVQQCMETATGATFLQLLLCLLLPCVLSTEVETDQDGNVKADPQAVGKYGFLFVEFIRYLCMIEMYGGATGVVVGMFLMNLENCDGKGMIPLVGHLIPKVPVPSGLASGAIIPGSSSAAAPAPAATSF